MARQFDDEELKMKADLIDQTPGVPGRGTARGLRSGVPFPQVNTTLPSTPSTGEDPSPSRPVNFGVRGAVETPLQIAQASPRPLSPEEKFLQDAAKGTNSVGAPSIFNPKPKPTAPKPDGKRSSYGNVRMASVTAGGQAISGMIGDALKGAYDVVSGRKSLRSALPQPAAPTQPEESELVKQIPTTTRESLRTTPTQPASLPGVREEEEVQSEQPVQTPSFDNSDISVDAGGKSRSETAPGYGGYPAPVARRGGGGFNLRNVPILPGAFGSMASLGAAGAVGRMQESQRKAEIEQERLGLSRDVAVANAARANAQLGLQASQQREAQRVQRGKEMDELFTDRATQIAGGPRPATGLGGTAGFGTAAETEAGAKERASRVKADMVSDVRYTLTNNKLGDISTAKPETLQLLQQMAVIRQRLNEGRAAGDRSLKEFFGENRFDSRDLLKYAPKKATKRFGGGWDIELRGGNVAKLERLQNGQFRLLGANDPIDQDIAELIAPLIREAENRR